MQFKSRIGVPLEEVAKYFGWFFPSLQQHAAQYLPLIFTDPSSAPPHHAYLCPLCLQNGIVLLDNIDLKISSEFSYDHFPPKSVGGFHIMIVCKECNNNAGGTFESSLIDQVTRMSLENRVPFSKVEAKTSISGIPGNYRGHFSIAANGESVLSFNDEGNKSAIYLNQWINTPGIDWEAKIDIRNPDQNKVTKAIVKAAYLFCFGTWGYEFAYSRSAEMMRKFLAGEFEYCAKVPLGWLGAELRKDTPVSLPVGPCYIQRPMEARSFVVNVVLKDPATGFKEIAVVPIPNPTDKGWEDLHNLSELFERIQINQTPVQIGHANQFTLQNGHKDGFSRSWAYLSTL